MPVSEARMPWWRLTSRWVSHQKRREEEVGRRETGVYSESRTYLCSTPAYSASFAVSFCT